MWTRSSTSPRPHGRKQSWTSSPTIWETSTWRAGFDPYVTDHGRIKCGCLAEFGDITEWRAHLAQAIIDNIDASEEGSETRDADE